MLRISIKKLRRPNLLEDIIDLAVFWKYLNAKYMGTNKAIDPYPYSISEDTRKYIQCLNYYPNEFWKFPISVFFIKNRSALNFDAKFNSILKELVAFLFVKFIYAPTVMLFVMIFFIKNTLIGNFQNSLGQQFRHCIYFRVSSEIL